MRKVQALKEAFLRLLRRIRRYPSEIRVTGAEYVEYEIDNMTISSPKQTYYYFVFEYILGTLFELTVATITVLFLIFNSDSPKTQQQFTFLKYWLRFGTILNLCAPIPKIVILRRLFKVPLNNERLIVRRLMLLVRSNVFFWNEKVSFVMYNYYIFGMSKLASGDVCGSMGSGLYRLCHFIICCFLLRLCNLFVRFFVEYYILTRNIQYDSIIDRSATVEEIAAIPVFKVTEQDMRELSPNEEEQWCGICLSRFVVGEEIKRLPCSEKHFFHKTCTDTWLQKQSICPYCRRALTFASAAN